LLRVGIAMLKEEEREKFDKFFERKEVKSIGTRENIMNKSI
jgi:CO dehydrogenase/acetyl-CoA synthase epsilon subunit